MPSNRLNVDCSVIWFICAWYLVVRIFYLVQCSKRNQIFQMSKRFEQLIKTYPSSLRGRKRNFKTLLLILLNPASPRSQLAYISLFTTNKCQISSGIKLGINIPVAVGSTPAGVKFLYDGNCSNPLLSILYRVVNFIFFAKNWNGLQSNYTILFRT